MILILMILFMLLFAFTFVLAKKKAQTILSLVFGFMFLLMVGLLIANSHSHFGMQKSTTTKETAIVSSIPQQEDLLLYKPVGKERIYLYRTENSQQKPTATETEDVQNQLERSNDLTAKKITTETSWVYSNDFSRLFFGILDNDHQLIQQKNTFVIPENWAVLDVETLKK